MLKVLVLTSGSGATAALCLPELTKASDVSVLGVVRALGMNPAMRRRHLHRKALKILEIGALGALNGLRIRKWFHAQHMPVEEVCQTCEVPLWNVPYIGSLETEQVFKILAADVGLSLGNTYIPERIFSLPRYGMLNLHSERLPEYQNAQSVIWPIFNGETTTGLTIHQITTEIDEGNIIYQERFPIHFEATLAETLQSTLLETRQRAVRAVRYSCQNFHELIRKGTKQKGGKHYTTPTIWQFLRMERNNRRLYRSSAQSGRRASRDSPL